ncbi:DUF6427 family protein [Winogradskyella sp. A2]|uniref:DUF6427 family protein n=1 Tax=Winogradskyella sp. A2 TaxID=3366944 RepID=UPI00398C39D6
MITRVFNKSKPINFIIVLAFVLTVFVITNFNTIFIDIEGVLFTLSKLILIVFLVFLVDFIVSKNNLTQGNSYAIMTFGILLAIFPQVWNNIDVLLSNLFIVFALRRIISLSSMKNIKKKLYDASFWIALATLFYFWSILFFAIVIVALIYYSQNDIKNIIIPIVGIATVAVFLLVYNILSYDVYIRPSNFERYASLDYTAYNSIEFITKLTVLFSSFVWTLVFFFRSLPEKNKKMRPSFFIVAWASIIAILIAIISPLKNGSEFIFFLSPFSIILGNYIEAISEHWFKEIFVGILIITALIGLFL